MLAQNATSTCANIRNRRIDQTQDQIQIVDHEVQDDSDIGRASGVDTLATTFDVVYARRLNPCEHRLPDGIEAFDMTDLEDRLVLRRAAMQFSGLIDAIGDGFFDEGMDASFESPFADPVVVFGRGRQDDRIDLVDQLGEIAETSDL